MRPCPNQHAEDGRVRRPCPNQRNKSERKENMRQPQLCSMPASSRDPAYSSASTAFLLEHITETGPGTENQEQYGDEAEQETDGSAFGRGGEG